MAFNSEEKAEILLRRNISKCRYDDLERWAPKYLNCTVSYLVEELDKRRLPRSVGNIALQICDYVKEEKMTCNEIVTIAVMFELENFAHNYCQKGIQWRANKFLHKLESCQLNSSSDFCDALRQAIIARKDDAKILMKQEGELLWMAVLYKRAGTAGNLTAPVYIVVTVDLRYVFWQRDIPLRLKEALLGVVKSHATKALKLVGADVQSLLLMLRGREKNSPPKEESAPLTQPLSSIENGIGVDFTGRSDPQSGPELNIQNYTIQPMHKRWMGDEAPELRLVELTSEVTFSGDVAAILARLPESGICSPPLPAFISNFAYIGKSRVVTNLRE